MTQFFDFVNTILNSIKSVINSVIDFFPSIFNFFTSFVDILPPSIKVVFLGVFSLCMGLLIYRWVRWQKNNEFL